MANVCHLTLINLSTSGLRVVMMTSLQISVRLTFVMQTSHPTSSVHTLPGEIFPYYVNIFRPTFFFWLHCMACRILVAQPGIEPVHPAVEAWSLNHRTVREVHRPTLRNNKVEISHYRIMLLPKLKLHY